MTAPIDVILDHFDAWRSSGPYAWIARCPAHDDRNPSLSIGIGDDGAVLLHCFAGCPVDEVLVGANLTFGDLASVKTPRPRPRPTTYDYHDEAGELLYTVVRSYDPKGFTQIPASGKRGRGAMDGVRRVLYRLPEVIAAVAQGRIIKVVEGEKDVDALFAQGEVATCNPGGAGKWRDEYSEFLRGATVLLIVDKDIKGRDHSRTVDRSLRAADCDVIAAEAAHGKDISDHLAAGCGMDELVLVDLSQPDLIPPRCLPKVDPASVVDILTVKPERVTWLWEGRLPIGKLVILEGNPEAGKSTLAIDIGGRVSAGAPMPDGTQGPAPGNVIYLCAEDGLADTVRPRLDASGHDIAGQGKSVHALQGRPDVTADGNPELRPISLPRDLDYLEAVIVEHQAVLVIVDVLNSYLHASVNGYNDQAMRSDGPLPTTG
jgi:hypothetical protein